MNNSSSQNSSISTWLVITIALLSMIGPFSIDTYLPSFPDIESDFRINRTLLTQSIGFYLVASGVSTLIWGPLSDRLGRRITILGTLAIYMVASVGCALAPSYTEFLAFRILQGIAASGGMIAGRAMIRDTHDASTAHKAMSYAMMLFAIAPAIAPIIGGWLHQAFGWRSVFYFLAIYGAIMWLMTRGFLRETLAHEARQSIHPVQLYRIYKDIALNHRYQLLVFCLAASFGGLFLYIAGSPTIIYDFLNMGSTDFSVQFIPMTSGIILGSFISGKLAHRYSPSTIVSIALAIQVAAGILNIAQAIWIDPAPISLIGPQVLYAFGIALIMPAISIMAMDCFPYNRGSATAVQSFVQMSITAAVASIYLPLLPASNIGFATGQTILLLLSVLLWLGLLFSSKLQPR